MTSPALEATAGPRLIWTHAPLVAFAIVSSPMLIPAVADFWKTLDLDDALFFLGLSFVPNWSFVALYLLTRQKAKTERSSVGSLRAAMWSSLVAMLMPIGLLWLYVQTQDYSVRGMGVGVAAVAFGVLIDFIFLLPVFGVIGWFVGRWLYRIRHRETGRQ